MGKKNFGGPDSLLQPGTAPASPYIRFGEALVALGCPKTRKHHGYERSSTSCVHWWHLRAICMAVCASKAPYTSQLSPLEAYQEEVIVLLLSDPECSKHANTPAMDRPWPSASIATTLEEFGGGPTSHGSREVPVPALGPAQKNFSIYIYIYVYYCI